MEKTFFKAEELAGNIKDYFHNRISAIKLSAAEKVSGVIANLAAGIFAAGVLFLFIVFSGIALSLVLGEWIGSTWAGFGLVALFYLLLGMLVWKLRKRIIQLPVMNSLIEKLFTSSHEED